MLLEARKWKRTSSKPEGVGEGLLVRAVPGGARKGWGPRWGRLGLYLTECTRAEMLDRAVPGEYASCGAVVRAMPECEPFKLVVYSA